MHPSKLVLAFMAALAVAFAASQSHATTFTTLTSFNGTNGDQPFGGLTLNGSTLYGTTSGGGANYVGTVFSLPVTGGTPTTLASFNGTNGAYPQGSLTLSADGSTLYGMTYSGGGGPNYDGNIFSIPVTGGTPTNLLSFNGTDGKNPYGDLTLSGSTLYGTTFFGGTGPYSDGTIFSIQTNGSGFQNLLSFNGTTQGSYPLGDLTLSSDGSILYGMGANNIFSIHTDGSNFQNLASNFVGGSSSPFGSLTLSGSTLYGTTTEGGANNDGMVFSIPVTGGTPTILASFNDANGAHPAGSLELIGSTLYGVAYTGGANGDGTIFSVPAAGGPVTTLVTFNNTNGAYPSGDFTLSGSTLYGTTVYGGADGDGTVFALNLATPEPSSVVLLGFGAIGLAAMTLRRKMRERAA